MLNVIRSTARVVTTIMNTCLNPMCLHAAKAKGCACCRNGHGAKKATKRTTSSRRRR